MKLGAVASSKRWLSLVVSLLVLLGIIGTTAVYAADPPPAQGIQVSPVLIDLNAEKGGTYNLKVTVTNVTAGTLVLKSAVNDFRAKDETGNPEVILDAKDTDPTFSFKSWAQPIPSLTLRSKESRTVTVTVAVPTGAEAGGHYGVIRFSGSPPGIDNTNIAISASVGILVLARVNGNIVESIKTKELFIEKNGHRTGLLQNGPFTVVERLQNDGNVHVKPTGTLVIKNMFGQTTASLKVNDPAKNVLPRSIRRFSQDVKSKWLFGRYTAHMDLTYGYSGKVVSGSLSFWVIPYKLIALVLIVGLLLGLFLRFIIRRHNDRVIKKALGRRR